MPQGSNPISTISFDFIGTAAPGSAAEWPDSPALDVVWKVDLGSGYSSLAVADGVVYTGFADNETDWLGAFDAKTGDRKWTVELGPHYGGHDGSHDGPIATPAVATIGDRTLVFAMGGHGRLVAASSDGKLVWSRELSEMGNAMGVDERSRAGRLALIQPFFLDSDREAIAEAAQARTEGQPSIYFELSPLTLRAEHEGWHAEDQTRRLSEALEEAGYEITLGSSNLPFVLDGLRPRVGPALAFALTGTAEVP